MLGNSVYGSSADVKSARWGREVVIKAKERRSARGEKRPTAGTRRQRDGRDWQRGAGSQRACEGRGRIDVQRDRKNDFDSGKVRISAIFSVGLSSTPTSNLFATVPPKTASGMPKYGSHRPRRFFKRSPEINDSNVVSKWTSQIINLCARSEFGFVLVASVRARGTCSLLASSRVKHKETTGVKDELANDWRMDRAQLVLNSRYAGEPAPKVYINNNG